MNHGHAVIRATEKVSDDPIDDNYKPHSLRESDGMYTGFIIENGFRIYIKRDYKHKSSAVYAARQLGKSFYKKRIEGTDSDPIPDEENARLTPKFGDLLRGMKGGLRLVTGVYTPKPPHKYAGILCVMFFSSSSRINLVTRKNYLAWAQSATVINRGIDL